MNSALVITASLLMADQAFAKPHAGLLDNIEMAQVTRNAEKTQRKFLAGQHIAACWPYDAHRKGALSGVAYCRVETPSMKESIVTFTRGPDLFCSYISDGYCEITSPDQ